MPLKTGDFVRHPNAADWGIGFVRRESDGVTTIYFSKAGPKDLWLEKVPFKMQVLPSGRDTVVAYHRESLESRGITYRGVKAVLGLRQRRVTHCYRCKTNLDNATDVECIACGWIICMCGACGCGYDHANR